MKYHVWCYLEMEDDVEAENEEEAFIKVSNDAMSGGSWQYDVKEIEDGDADADSN